MNSHFLLKACGSCFFARPRNICVFERTNANHRHAQEHRPLWSTQCKPRRGGRVIASRGWSVAEPTAGVGSWTTRGRQLRRHLPPSGRRIVVALPGRLGSRRDASQKRLGFATQARSASIKQPQLVPLWGKMAREARQKGEAAYRQ